MTPLAYLILDNAGRICDFGPPTQESYLFAAVEKWNANENDSKPYRLVPVAEIPAWQPIETARKYGKPIILGRFGCSTPGRWHGGMFRADNINIADEPPWTHWQPLPAPPKEAPDAKS